MEKQHLLHSEQALGELPWLVSKLWPGHPRARTEPHVKPQGKLMLTLAEQDLSGVRATKDRAQHRRLLAAAVG